MSLLRALGRAARGTGRVVKSTRQRAAARRNIKKAQAAAATANRRATLSQTTVGRQQLALEDLQKELRQSYLHGRRRGRIQGAAATGTATVAAGGAAIYGWSKVKSKHSAK